MASATSCSLETIGPFAPAGSLLGDLSLEAAAASAVVAIACFAQAQRIGWGLKRMPPWECNIALRRGTRACQHLRGRKADGIEEKLSMGDCVV